MTDSTPNPGKRTAGIILFGGLGIAAIVGAFLFVAPKLNTGDMRRSIQPDDKRWHAVAPGRVEAWSGDIKLAANIVAPVAEVLVQPNDRVIAGEPLIRLQDEELKAKLAIAETQVALRLRARNDQSASGRAADRRRAEDNVSDAEKALNDARLAFDRAAAEKKSGAKPESDLHVARTAWTQAQDRLRQRRAELRKLETDKDIPLPSSLEGQLTIARNELTAIEAATEKLTVRAPINGSVLQVNAKAGELASPSSPQPLVLVGDVSALRVRAEIDERDLGEVKVGQQATVRASAFPGREFGGKVSFVAPLVEPARNGARGQRSMNDVDIAEVVVDLSEAGPLAVGMKVDVYFFGTAGK
jgi:HlyD family secretion protein